MTNPAIPVSYIDLKQSLREGLAPSSRVYWWPYLPQLNEGDPIESYPNIEEIAATLLHMMKPDSLSGGVPEDVTSEICQILIRKNLIENIKIMEEFVNIISSIITRKDICYLLTSHVIGNSEKYVCTEYGSLSRRLYTYKVLLSYYMPKTYAILDSIKALEDRYLNMIFIGYFKNLFPKSITYHIMDSFLLEGVKIIYRYGLALMRIHKSFIKSGRFKSGEMFWDYVATFSLTTESARSLDHYAFDVDRNLLQKIRRPMKIGRTDLKKINDIAASSLSHLESYEIFIPTHLQSNQTNQVKDKKKESLIHSTSTTSTSYSTSNTTISIETKISKISSLLTEKLSNDLFSFLPDTMKFVSFELVFSSSIHGYNMETMYQRTINRNPCILLIKSTNSPIIVGGFLTVPISPPSTTIRGDGNTICFKLEDNNSVCYRWVGTQSSPSSSMDLIKEQYTIFSRSYFAFGGSAIHGSNAVRVDGDLRKCSCGYSDTFGNPPMLFEGKPFDIEILEVWCG